MKIFELVGFWMVLTMVLATAIGSMPTAVLKTWEYLLRMVLGQMTSTEIFWLLALNEVSCKNFLEPILMEHRQLICWERGGPRLKIEQ